MGQHLAVVGSTPRQALRAKEPVQVVGGLFVEGRQVQMFLHQPHRPHLLHRGQGRGRTAHQPKFIGFRILLRFQFRCPLFGRFRLAERVLGQLDLKDLLPYPLRAGNLHFLGVAISFQGQLSHSRSPQGASPATQSASEPDSPG